MRKLTVLCLLLLLSAFSFGDGPITIFLAGDSTMAQKLASRRPETGWGEFLQQFFDQDDVRVENYARNGRSTRTFLEEGRWQAILDRLREGDYVFIQFGHNDASANKPERYTPPEDYRRNLVRFIGDVRARGGNPVLMTPVASRRFNEDGTFRVPDWVYPEIVKQVAAEQAVPLIDMQGKGQRVIESRGVEGSKRLFLHLQPGEHPNYPAGIEDNTHFSTLGAEIMATVAAEGIREAVPGLAEHLRQPAQPVR